VERDEKQPDSDLAPVEGSPPGSGGDVVDQARQAARSMARECLGSRVRILSRAITRVFDEHFRPFDVTGAQLYLIGAIGLFGPSSPAELARSLSMDKSTLSRNLQRLVERGLITVDDATTGRGQVVDLTAEGGELLIRVQPSWSAAQEDARAILGEGDADLLRALGNRVWQLEFEG
jgi:DNA-binding MarR family transcriptional regulator